MAMKPSDLILNVVVVLITIQAGSYVLSSLFSIPVLSLGRAILLVISFSAFALAITGSLQIGRTNKNDLIMLVAIVGLIIAIFKYLPEQFPEIFSIIKPTLFSAIR